MTEHPSKDILGTLGQEITGNKVALCVTGSISAYQCPELARRLMRHGAEVYTFMSPTSQNIIHPNLMEWASGNPVITELTGKIEHIALSDPDEISLVLV
ncbi:MAG: bifunctional phosphopantothenoylcysteine decarboxylase/phosphopantothenate--cysteine ligase CoaBC, partial [Nitrososphaeria archaeon]|nr:bifunctional phosphopantothenoylcysteine decarboxylase/phosphopantothenate--cysteine ligase CoaBC [Nitrososphaeria archaeon]NIQ33175.1 bifunctional phosphopantothenoylcysteine decarboxylase/phosphopantothenate--cysteine ligase CoaBC [Nitrososphaeria archaeon]